MADLPDISFSPKTWVYGSQYPEGTYTVAHVRRPSMTNSLGGDEYGLEIAVSPAGVWQMEEGEWVMQVDSRGLKPSWGY